MTPPFKKCCHIQCTLTAPLFVPAARFYSQFACIGHFRFILGNFRHIWAPLFVPAARFYSQFACILDILGSFCLIPHLLPTAGHLATVSFLVWTPYGGKVLPNAGKL